MIVPGKGFVLLGTSKIMKAKYDVKVQGFRA
jgi:hypothetical protein